MIHRVAFYPCCATDFQEPLELLREFADEVVFCDLNPGVSRRLNKITSSQSEGLPRSSFRCEDAQSAVESIKRIDVLFYRRDGVGEGGSGIFVLGDTFLPELLKRFPAQGGYIITDGSNSGGNFERMTSTSGLTKYGWHLKKTDSQPFLAGRGLYVISVTRANLQNAKPTL